MGLVEEVRDPEKLGRIKVRVPAVFGTGSNIGVDELPWAIPFGLPAGGSSASGGMDWLPGVGDQAVVQFLDGDPEKPIWTWSMQTKPQQKNFPVHSYDTAGKPMRVGITRYGHTIELAETTIIITTRKGNAIVIDDALDGSFIKINDTIHLTVDDIQVLGRNSDVDLSEDSRIKCRNATLVAENHATLIEEDAIHKIGGSFTMLIDGPNGTNIVECKDGAISLVDQAGACFTTDGEGNVAITAKDGTALSLEPDKAQVATPKGTSVVVEGDQVSINAQKVTVAAGEIALGDKAIDQPVLTNKFLALFNTHVHGNGNNGSPTTPPMVPLVAQQIGSETTSIQ